ncbi:MAG TPA: hypothetical protein VFZ24_00250 [Longimicrobiales bacterium]
MHRSRIVCTAALAFALFAAAGPLAAQNGRGCTEPIHRAFDFWIGEWEVRLENGSVAGRNTIRAMAGGCGLAESWRGASGTVGESLNHYDPADGQWHQLWIDSSGLVLRLAGSPIDGGMRLESRPRDGAPVNRITWTLLEDGRVRQLWEVSSDGGGTWQVVFDGYYVKQ